MVWSPFIAAGKGRENQAAQLVRRECNSSPWELVVSASGHLLFIKLLGNWPEL